MAATGRSAGDLAARLADAPFVRVAPRADGDAIAAAGLLLRALADRSIPFQARVVAPTADPPVDDATIPIGFDDGPAPGDRPASAVVAEAVRDLDCEPDPALALAGCYLAGASPSTLDLDVPFERRDGVGIPTADLADGLAHSTLVHAGFSGDEERVAAALAELSNDDGRSVASLLALETVGTEGATSRAAERVERALRPHATPDGPFESLEGYADVLDCLAHETPGLALALAMGHDVRVEALETWRAHAKAAHRGLREATTDRYDGLFVARVDGPVRDSASDADGPRPSVPLETIARLSLEFRSPEPIALAVAGGEAAAASVEDASIGETMEEATNAVGGIGGGTASRGTAEFDAEPSAFVDAVRGAMA
ncbi:exonuclease RecJ [Halalkalicoccus ordinarius]|uniref:exonuclease RecJ n=1 Tax=Halalkalicoccus ordinarius TaxID=3116651 RepID=UPI00300EF8A7